MLPKNFGVIIRTAAMNASDADVEHDIRSLVDKWHTALQNVKKSTAPALLLSEQNRANTIIRDSLDSSFSQITVDDETMFNEIRNYIRVIAPEKEKIVKLYRGKVPIFDNFDISKQIKSLFAKYVSLKRGAYLIIEHTEAMNVIDVNSGNRTKAEDDQEQTALDVNLAAAREIARQLRLRDLGGIVIIDFIDLHKAVNRQTLYDEMTKLMATDKAKHTILPLTKFGLMQITRQRVRPVAVEEVKDVCPHLRRDGQDRADHSARQEDREQHLLPDDRPRAQIPQIEGQPLCFGVPSPWRMVAAPALDVALQDVAAHRRGPERRHRRYALLRQAGQTTAVSGAGRTVRGIEY